MGLWGAVSWRSRSCVGEAVCPEKISRDCGCWVRMRRPALMCEMKVGVSPFWNWAMSLVVVGLVSRHVTR